jgi:hypothetical protein
LLCFIVLHSGWRAVQHLQPHQHDDEATRGLKRRHRDSKGSKNWPARKRGYGKNDRGGVASFAGLSASLISAQAGSPELMLADLTGTFRA